ncbi:TPA: hypothetical protein PEP05_000765 [Vibrio parahaemolyticus]|nr:hypothetical protein [Vibrio parahaemolyticus]
MNPNFPLSYYQLGAVTVVNGTPTVIGYKTEWVSSKLESKPIVGSTFTVDQANFYTVLEVIDDETIKLDKDYIGSTTERTSYLIINQLEVDFTEDDRITAEAILAAAAASAQEAKDWAIKMDGPVNSTEEYSSKYHAIEAKGFAEDAAASASEASDTAELLSAMKEKLDGIEDNATADQSAIEVETNQDTHAELPTNVQAALDALWGRPTGGLPEGDLDLKNNKVTNLKAGESPLEGVNFQQLTEVNSRVDSIENITGSARRGPITVSTESPSGVPVQFEEWVQIGDVDGGVTMNASNKSK